MPKEPLSDAHREVLEKLEAVLNANPKNKPLDEKGREVLDPRPVAPPIGYIKQPTMVDHIRSLVKSELLRKAADEMEAETFEEADDFDVPDDDEPPDPHTPYEAVFDPPPENAPQAQGTQPQAGGSGVAAGADPASIAAAGDGAAAPEASAPKQS